MSDSTFQEDGSGQEPTRVSHYLWVILPLITGANLAQSLMRQGLPVLYPFIQDEFGLSRAQIGLITSALAIGFMAAVLVAGWLTDTFGVKRISIIALLVLTAFTLAFPLVYSFSILLALAVLISIVDAPIHPATTRAVMDWFPDRIRALAMGIKQMGVPLAGALVAAVLPALALAIGWRMAAAATGLLVLAIAIAFILLYREAPRGIQVAHKFNLAALKPIFQNRGLMTTMAWSATFVGFQFIVLSYFMLFAIEELGFSPVMAGGLLAITQVISIIARVLWGAISDFFFHGRRMAILVIIGFMTVLWMLGASFISTGVPGIAIYLIAIIIGISNMSFHGVLITLVGEQAESGQVGMTVGVASTLNHVSQMAVPFLFGYLVDISSSYSLVWRITAVVALVMTLVLWTFGREQQRH